MTSQTAIRIHDAAQVDRNEAASARAYFARCRDEEQARFDAAEYQSIRDIAAARIARYSSFLEGSA